MVQLLNRQSQIVSPWLAGILCIQFALLLYQAYRWSPVYDEWGQLPAGLHSLRTGDQSPYSVNPPLVRYCAAAVVYPFTKPFSVALQTRRPEWKLGDDFEAVHGLDCYRLFFIGRSVIVAVTLAGTILLWFVLRDLYNELAATTGAALWAFSPTALTFGVLIVPDMPLTVLGFAATAFTVRLIQRPSWDRVYIACFVHALAFLCKTSWVIVLVVGFVTAVCLVVGNSLHQRKIHWVAFGKIGAGSLVIWLVVCTAYEFKGLFTRLGDFPFQSSALRSETKTELNRFSGTVFESIPVPLPYHLLIGLDIQKTDFESRMPSYFMGTWRDHGWYQYYVVAWLLKEPPVFWLLVLLGGLKGGWLRRDEWLLVAPGLLILGFVSLQTGFNHHLRYTLPVFPALVIFAVRWLRPNSFHRAVAFSLVSVYVLSMVSVYPRTYCYFTELVGGASQGWRYLGDSNLDWGQDMRTVHEWLQRNPDKQPVLGFRSTPFGNSLHPYVIKPAVQSCVELDGVCYPMEAGWWLMPKRAFIENSSEWFRKQPASEVLSLTYSVYYIDQSMIDGIEMPMR